MRSRVVLAVFAGLLTGCSSTPETSTAASPRAPQPNRVPASSNPVAKYIELTGFRIDEKGPGKLEIRFAVVNHSEADLGNVSMTVNLRATTSKPNEPPLASFNARVDGLGPEDLKQVAVTVPTKLRVYELPDWQFLRSDFEVTEPK